MNSFFFLPMRMNTEIKKKWLSALRSGEYLQSKGTLKNEDGYCCLGVLCDLYAKEHDDVNWEHRTFEDSQCDKFYFDGNSEYLSLSVIEWAGLKSHDPSIQIEYENVNDNGTTFTDYYEQPLSELNDEGVSFMKIADYIEDKL